MSSQTIKKLGGVAATGLLAFGLAACSGDDSAAPSNTEESTSPQSQELDPREVVAASVDRFSETSYRIVIDGGEVISGDMAYDPANKSYQGTTTVDLSSMDESGMMTGSMSIEMIVIGDDQWMKMTGGLSEIFGDQWIHSTVDEAAAEELGAMDLKQLTDEMFQTLTNVEQVDENTYTAQTDATEFGGSESDEPLNVTLVLDDEGKLVEMTTEMPHPADETQTLPITISIEDYGVPITVEAPPADQVVEMDDLFKS